MPGVVEAALVGPITIVAAGRQSSGFEPFNAIADDFRFVPGAWRSSTKGLQDQDLKVV